MRGRRLVELSLVDFRGRLLMNLRFTLSLKVHNRISMDLPAQGTVQGGGGGGLEARSKERQEQEAVFFLSVSFCSFS